MFEMILSLFSVLLALLSILYARAVARDASHQAQLLRDQTSELKTQTDRISDMTEQMSNIALNIGQTDYFTLRSLVAATGSNPTFDAQGNLKGYEYRDSYGSASLVFHRGNNPSYLADVTLNNRSQERTRSSGDPNNQE